MMVVVVLAAMAGGASAEETARTRLADGFDMPVGKPDGDGYFIQRGFRPNGHLGEDWDGIGGGNTDFGKPVYSVAHGMVVLARDAHMGWGNVVIVRHAYLEGGEIKMVDSLYAHMDRITVREGQQVLRGQQVGTIGTNHGMYVAHLHFEMRKNIYIGVNHSAFKRDLSNYYVPSNFIGAHRHLSGAGRSATITINTFDLSFLAKFADGALPQNAGVPRSVSESASQGQKASSHRTFQIDRFGDL
jgi:murein DD-endopeptidase MepM/ murein hydrolase activator NlpD